MSQFGFQCFDKKGNILWDHSAIFTRVLGMVDIPFYDYTQLPVSGVINHSAFSNGSPFCFWVPVLTVPVTNLERANEFHSPNVNYIDNSIHWSITKYTGMANDDSLYILGGGNIKLFYGVYTK